MRELHLGKRAHETGDSKLWLMATWQCLQSQTRLSCGRAERWCDFGAEQLLLSTGAAFLTLPEVSPGTLLQSYLARSSGDLEDDFADTVTAFLLMKRPQALSKAATKPGSLSKELSTSASNFLCTFSMVCTYRAGSYQQEAQNWLSEQLNEMEL